MRVRPPCLFALPELRHQRAVRVSETDSRQGLAEGCAQYVHGVRAADDGRTRDEDRGADQRSQGLRRSIQVTEVAPRLSWGRGTVVSCATSARLAIRSAFSAATRAPAAPPCRPRTASTTSARR